MRTILNLLFAVLIVGAILYLFAPHVFSDVGNSLINSINGSAAHGLASYLPKSESAAGKNGDLQVKLDGLQPKTTYTVTLDSGQCGGAPMQELGHFTSDSNGSGSADIPLNSLSTGQTWYVDIHQGSSSAGQSVACGQLSFNSQQLPQLNLAGSTSSSSQVDVNVGSGSAQTTTGSSGFTNSSGSGGFPNTGVAPAGSNSYDNYTFPRKY